MRAVAGLGFREQASSCALRQALNEALRAARRAGRQPILLQALASAADKCDHPALRQLAAELALPVQAVAMERLRAQPAQPSAHVPGRYGKHSLAEAAALAAAGPGATLAAQRHTSLDRCATAAIAINLSPTETT